MPISWEELSYRLLHCDECGCHYEHPRSGCACVCGHPDPYEGYDPHDDPNHPDFEKEIE